jgi:hypothetical protein
VTLLALLIALVSPLNSGAAETTSTPPAMSGLAAAVYLATVKDPFERIPGNPNIKALSAKYDDGLGSVRMSVSFYRPVSEFDRENFVVHFYIGKCSTDSVLRALTATAFLDGQPANWEIQGGGSHSLDVEWNIRYSQITLSFESLSLKKRSFFECIRADLDYYHPDRPRLECSSHSCYWTSFSDWDETADARFRKKP